jgi:hydroxymethylpyrimidine/phosphomethylpyrimidine kinase
VSRPIVCSIGTTEPWNAAGLGLDVRVLVECGVRPVTIVAAVSAQDARGITALVPMEPAVVRAQWAALAGANIAAIRVGALAGAATVSAVAEILRETAVPVIYDPALRATRGGAFVDAAALQRIVRELLPLATVCTPNLFEAAQLGGCRGASVDDMEAAGRALLKLGPKAVLVTGGDLPGDPVDVLVEAERTTRFAGTRIAAQMRGTGCVLAAVLAAELAKGRELRAAVEHARAFVRRKIAGAVRTGDFSVAD